MISLRSLLLVALFSGHAINVSAAQISTVAGSGTKGFSGDSGPATQSQIAGPDGICSSSDGAVYICDTENQRIRKVSRDGTMATVAGNGTRGYSGDGGPATVASLNEPYEARLDSAGNLFFVERLSHTVRRVDAKTGFISTVAGTGKAGFSGDGGPGEKAEMKEPHSIGFDRAGDLYICDIGNHRIRKVEMKSGIISTFAGTGEKKPTPDGAPIAGTPLNGPRALDFDKEGNLWLALREGNAIYKLDPVTGTIHHMAGTGKHGFTGNGGPAREATLSGPKGIAVGLDGNVYIADTESHSIRMLDLKKKTLELVAGTGVKGNGPDGDPILCKLQRPHGVFVGADGALYIGDTENNRVRRLQP
ncbi:MAG: pknD 5 [Chthoniobacteraceae bacterium]|nr:pknD 5 [Chthoniobacteraceae bacterium]